MGRLATLLEGAGYLFISSAIENLLKFLLRWTKCVKLAFIKAFTMKIYLTHGKNVQTKNSQGYGFSSHVYQEQDCRDPLVNKL